MADFRHHMAQVVGNFLVAFFVPMTGNSITQEITNHAIDLNSFVFASFVSSMIYTGLSVGYELRKWGYGRR